ncbi:MAG: glycoside hydrolase family 25 protein [Lewinellaceae bacterium]|nr:glycoside hydrolase family 25 protein [Phaeodactylibacter sp.]MCB9038454.1 glycoside hydrolase family 25 protein [Lewinellaceae bacterium]
MRHFLTISILALALTACEHQTVRLQQYEVHGIDISHYQSTINWDSVMGGDELHFAFVKATEGISMTDTLFCRNWEEMKRVGLYRGAYHFFRPTLPAEWQADNFLDAVEMEYGDLPPVLDVEVLDGASKVQLITGVRTWLYLVEIRYNTKPILYTNLKFYNKYLAGQFDDYPIWIARYNSREPSLACGRDWQFWQYGNRGRLSGINGHVDFNVFNGSLKELESLCFSPPVILSHAFVKGP